MPSGQGFPFLFAASWLLKCSTQQWAHSKGLGHISFPLSFPSHYPRLKVKRNPLVLTLSILLEFFLGLAEGSFAPSPKGHSSSLLTALSSASSVGRAGTHPAQASPGVGAGQRRPQSQRLR